MTHEQEVTLEKLRRALDTLGASAGEGELRLPDRRGVNVEGSVASLAGLGAGEPATLDVEGLRLFGVEALRSRLEVCHEGETALAGISLNCPRLAVAGAVRLRREPEPRQLEAAFTARVEGLLGSWVVTVDGDGTTETRSVFVTANRERSHIEVGLPGLSGAREGFVNTFLNLGMVKSRLEAEVNRRLAGLAATFLGGLLALPIGGLG